jgi:exodeoxyribonuclease V alpha subunit
MTLTPSMNKSQFSDIIARLQARKRLDSEYAIAEAKAIDYNTYIAETEEPSGNMQATDKYGKLITYNDKQQEFIDLASTRKSCILIGPAGTGKTTGMQGAVEKIIQNPDTKILQAHDHKYLPHGVPGIVICAFTRRATNNIRRNMTEHMKANCITIHKLLEYGPMYYDIVDEKGNEKKTMRFEPMRHRFNPLPLEVSTIIFEESSMIGTSLYAEVLAAMPPGCQIIFLGDIQQLPPVFGPAILGFKMLELPVVELTEVYRQALESPIIRLAHRILSGNPIPAAELPEWKFPGQMKITPWQKKIDSDAALSVTEKLFIKLYEDGAYNPEEDMILIPFNKQYGTLELNKSIANHLARRKQLVTWEVIAGFMKHYFTIGDKVLFDREDAIIEDIFPNPSYTGASAQAESHYLDYWGHNNTPTGEKKEYNESATGEDIDFLLAQVSASDDSEDRVTQSSHHIKLHMLDSDTHKTITKAAEVNALLLGYALTVHKAQGSEWDKVFVLFHNSHATMMQRELLYTAVTRAKKELFIICEKDTFTSAINRQRIKGNTLAEKAEYFKGKIESGDEQS